MMSDFGLMKNWCIFDVVIICIVINMVFSKSADAFDAGLKAASRSSILGTSPTCTCVQGRRYSS